MAELSASELAGLREVPLLSAVEDAEWAVLGPLFVRWTVPAGEEPIRQGQEATGLHVILHGRCRVFSGERLVDELTDGDVFGELSLLAAGRARATVRAVRDLATAFLSREAFDRAAGSLPRLLRSLGRVAAERAATSSPDPPSVPPAIGNIALLAVGPGLDLRAFATLLAEPGADGTATEVLGSPRVEAERLQATARFADLDRTADLTITLPDPSDPDWTRRCLRQADRVVLLARGDSPPEPTDAERTLLGMLPEGTDVFLVLLHPRTATAGSGTARWLEGRDLAGHVHVRTGVAADYARCLRLLTDSAIGLVLGGASSRGIGHLGVARALREAGIPIDVVAGSSSGALFGAVLALGLPHDESVRRGSEILETGRPRLRTMGPPLVAIDSGRLGNEAIQRAFGGRRQEDLFLTCIFTATDLARGTLVQLTTGPVWKNVRASASLPAIWPPVVAGDRVLIDGGVLDNIPVTSLAKPCRRGLIFAADLNAAGADSIVPGFADLEDCDGLQSGWAVAWNRLAPGSTRKRFPALIDILTHTMLLASKLQTAQLEGNQQPNLCLLRIPLPDEGFFAAYGEAAVALADRAQRQAAPRVQEAWRDHRLRWRTARRSRPDDR